MIEMTNQIDSGTSAIAVTRCAHQWPTPSFAEPRPRTRPNDERSSMSTSGGVGENQGEQRAHGGERQHGEAGGAHLRQLEAPTEVPGEVPDAVAEMVEQREG